MANTRADIQLSATDYVNAYVLSGITVGTALVIQNKTSQPIRIQISPTKPVSTSRNGVILEPGELAGVDAGESGCWIKGFVAGKISVQEA